MSSQIPFTPLTPESMERLTLDEALAFEAATCAVAGDQKPSLEVVATLVLTIQRLITEAAPDAAASDREVRDRMPEASPPPARELWEQAGGGTPGYDRDRYITLLREHGHLLSPGDDGYEEAPAGLPCGWQPRPGPTR